MNMSEKVGRLGRGLQRVGLSSHGRENLRESNVLPDNFSTEDNFQVLTDSESLGSNPLAAPKEDEKANPL